MYRLFCNRSMMRILEGKRVLRFFSTVAIPFSRCQQGHGTVTVKTDFTLARRSGKVPSYGTLLTSLVIALFHDSRTLYFQKERDREGVIKMLEKSAALNKLSELELEIHRKHLAAIKAGENTYIDPASGFEVFTILNHLRQGSCCGNACRHCPFSHMNVPPGQKGQKKFNSAFYC